jgi:hypothetical protein
VDSRGAWSGQLKDGEADGREVRARLVAVASGGAGWATRAGLAELGEHGLVRNRRWLLGIGSGLLFVSFDSFLFLLSPVTFLLCCFLLCNN